MFTKADFSIRIDRCIDDESTWLWEVVDFNGDVKADGYSSSKREAREMAEQSRQEQVDYFNGND